MKRILLILLMVSLCACGCKTAKKSADKPDAAPVASTAVNDKPAYKLTGTKWMLTHINTQEIGDCPEKPYMTLTGDRISGNLGCNSFFGSYEVNKKNKMTINFEGSTKRLCQQMEVEKQFTAAWRMDINRYELKGDELILYSGEDEIMRFSGTDLSKAE